MHTAICSFDDRATAQRAVDRLIEAGFDRRDVHLTHRQADGTQLPTDEEMAGMEHEIALGPNVLHSIGKFFGNLFGRDEPHAGTYTRAVERGHYVVVVDGPDEATAMRAQNMLHGLEPGDMNVVHRAEQPPLRDIVAERQSTLREDVPVTGGRAMEQTFGTARAEMPPSQNTGMRSGSDLPREREMEREREMQRERELERERAVASSQGGWSEPRATPPRDPDDGSHAPGLRYSDQDPDKPNR